LLFNANGGTHATGFGLWYSEHTFTQDERVAAEKLGELFGTGWPEKETGKLIFFPKSKHGLLGGCDQQAIANQ